MEESQKKTKRDEKARNRQEDKKRVEVLEKTIQSSNPINLRMTNAFVKKVISNRRKSFI